MPFSLGFQIYPWLERLLRLRQRRLFAYGSALALVALGALGRWAVSDNVGAHVPFITFYPAILLATMIGGLGPGIAATVFSTFIAWLLFLPPAFSFTFGAREQVQLLLFVVICAANIGIIALLNLLVERLVLQQRNIGLLLEAAPAGMVLVDEGGTIKLVNAATEKLFGYPRSELTGRNVEVLVPARLADEHRKARSAYQATPEVRQMGQGRDLSGRRKDGTEFPVEVGLNPVAGSGHSGVLATVLDITARKRAEHHQQLIVRELEHRTRNLFAVVQALVAMSLRDARTVAEAREVLAGRIAALSQAYALLEDGAWEGASLAMVLQRQLGVYAARVAIDGCETILSPQAAQQFTLIVHELVTNAVKHGALSRDQGSISVAGRIESIDGRDCLVFTWTESGGPPVTAPTRRGFGSVILLESAGQFGRKVTMEFPADGLRYELQVDLQAIEMPARRTEQRVVPMRAGAIGNSADPSKSESQVKRS